MKRLILFLCVFAPLIETIAAEPSKPNVLLLMVDDLNSWLLGETNRYAGKVIAPIVIQSGLIGILGRATRVALAERERLSVEPSLAQPDNLHPTAMVQLLATLDIINKELVRGIVVSPSLGDKVYSAPPGLLKWVASVATAKKTDDKVKFDLG
jgi:hypothetical protein